MRARPRETPATSDAALKYALYSPCAKMPVCAPLVNARFSRVGSGARGCVRRGEQWKAGVCVDDAEAPRSSSRRGKSVSTALS
ncbi:hypothetical protein HBI55_090080 [Parastagonospora nodorum]|nr:hypothetical protein HBI30_040420 [Parastagonospora nodorum]KAH5481684.1 hypothetical protein HBI28_019490 [Parastagonospora nodorum]KAH5631057.1 hypothetical protein HBI22_117400 [Parastagonospora nodorum]KAH5683878.1 hypothetical protein HBI21_022320 [Parastagonospora nodorum]KAH6035202.1 hypothetical protein HBI83_001490 [Parastagonospora nodorum]